ncbi:helix-turn-helix domain-containing protein [Streptomyces sp. NPDC088760]|uniref:helix-turn-helix domain-containing protein n=1 Tax=Streptomyces sp. NPDC088760 TaxID=3365890 RepID=UPI003807682D
MGRPPLAYLTECRIDEAAALLTDTDLSIAQIGRSVGYADAFGFSAARKRRKGLSLAPVRSAPRRPESPSGDQRCSSHGDQRGPGDLCAAGPGARTVIYRRRAGCTAAETTPTRCWFAEAADNCRDDRYRLHGLSSRRISRFVQHRRLSHRRRTRPAAHLSHRPGGHGPTRLRHP